MMIDLEKIFGWAMLMLSGAALVILSHVLTMNSVMEDINRWRTVSIESQELADKCIEELEDSTTPIT
jgi:hypothetical protein